jgi:4-azaleucine resistance transporter AzlC
MSENAQITEISVQTTPTSQFWAGVRAELPLLLGVIPFGMIYGMLALEAGLTPIAAQAMSSLLFAGSAQILTVELVRTATPGFIIILTIFLLNLRHMLYSASVAPYLKKTPLRWKLLLAYLLTDEAYAVTIINFTEHKNTSYRHMVLLGAGITLWSAWQLSTAAGILLGAVIPTQWSLDFTIALTFIALAMPAIRDRPGLVAALTAGVTAILAYSLPYKLGLVLASLVGIAAGMWSERSR